MYQNSLITSAGGINVAKSLPGSNWNEISKETLLGYNPEFDFAAGIIISILKTNIINFYHFKRKIQHIIHIWMVRTGENMVILIMN